MEQPIKKYTDVSSTPSAAVAQLRYATLPKLLRPFCIHYWFVVYDLAARKWNRWEVWQSANAGGKSWGHIYKDLWHPDRKT
ncbi:MAG: hypothetical protein IIA61_09025 [Candidatus Marinimicrobia bacterium]|nr:hypothetical protein [Candidatus Neomarinimicrobiota bacterium]